MSTKAPYAMLAAGNWLFVLLPGRKPVSPVVAEVLLMAAGYTKDDARALLAGLKTEHLQRGSK